MEIFLYSVFITLTFLLSLVSPIIIGSTIIKSGGCGNIFSKIIAWIFSKLENLSTIFSYIYNFLNYIFTYIFRNYNSNKKESFCTMVNATLTISIITLIYYIISYFNLTTVFLELREIITANIGEQITIKSTFELIIDNGVVIISFFKLDNWFIRLFIQILISIIYLAIVYYGIDGIEQLKSNNDNGGIHFKLGIIESVTLKNIIILCIITFVTLLILSLGSSVNEVALIFLIFNIFNIEISLGTAVVTLAPLVVEKVYVNYKYRSNDSLKDPNIF